MNLSMQGWKRLYGSFISIRLSLSWEIDRQRAVSTYPGLVCVEREEDCGIEAAFMRTCMRWILYYLLNRNTLVKQVRDDNGGWSNMWVFFHFLCFWITERLWFHLQANADVIAFTGWSSSVWDVILSKQTRYDGILLVGYYLRIMHWFILHLYLSCKNVTCVQLRLV